MRRSTVLVLLLGVLAGLGIAVSATTVGGPTPIRWTRPAESQAAPAQPGSWSPRIAFQFYETGGIDAPYLAEHGDWLMLRYGVEGLRDELRELGYQRPLPQYLLLCQILGVVLSFACARVAVDPARRATQIQCLPCATAEGGEQ